MDSQVPSAMMPVLSNIQLVMRSLRNRVPHSMPNTGIRKVTVRAWLGPMRSIKRKKTICAKPVQTIPRISSATQADAGTSCQCCKVCGGMG